MLSATDSHQLLIGCKDKHWIVGNGNWNIGIGTDYPDAAVGVGVTAKLSVGIVSAYQLYGDGSNLTGLAGFSPDDQGNLYAGTDAGAASDADTTCNIAIGQGAGKSLNAGDCNVLIGFCAGEAATQSSRLVAIGYKAAQCAQLYPSGFSNVFIGAEAGRLSCRGQGNVAIGHEALKGGEAYQQEIDNSIFIGQYAGTAVCRGADAIWMGCKVGAATTDAGTGNIWLGNQAGGGAGTDVGNSNIFIGSSAGKDITTGNQNTFMGSFTGTNIESGSYNAAYGRGAGQLLTTGSSNTFLGRYAGCMITTASNNVVIGMCAGCNKLDATTSEQVAIGVGNRVHLWGECKSFGVIETTIAGIATVYSATGIVSATSFYGDGSNLTGLAGFSADSQENLYAGTGAGANSNADSCYNVGIGYSALHNYASNNTFDGCNVAIGKEAGYTVTGTNTGLRNIYIGDKAGYGHDSNNSIFIGTYTAKAGGGSENVVIGGFAGCAMQAVAAQRLVIIGQCAGKNQCNAGDNTFLGHSAGRYNKTGGFNVFVGAYAGDGCSNNSAANNVAIGFNAANCISTGGQNTFVGNLAGGKITTGNGNVAVGAHAGCETTTSGYNVYLGDSAGRNMQTGGYNFAGGYAALHGSGTAADNTGDYNVALGYKAGNVITSGSDSILIGCQAGDAITTGNRYIAIGKAALSAEDTAGEGAIAIGCGALLQQNATTGNNTAVGYQAGCNLVDATENVFMGFYAGRGVTGSNNVALGPKTLLSSTSGGSNVAVGQDAMRQNTGSSNVVMGATAMWSAGDGTDNVIIGQGAGYAITDGDKNTFLGKGNGNTVTTGCCNVLIGYEVDSVAASDKIFKIGISANSWITGDSSFNTTVNTISASNFNSTSDIRLKTNIQPIGDPIGKVKQIEGVSFNWKKDNKPALGVIADQVEKILPELVHGDDPKTVNYNGLIGLLIETVKEQQNQIDELNDRISKLE